MDRIRSLVGCVFFRLTPSCESPNINDFRVGFLSIILLFTHSTNCIHYIHESLVWTMKSYGLQLKIYKGFSEDQDSLLMLGGAGSQSWLVVYGVASCFFGKATKILSHSPSLLWPSSYSVHLRPWLLDLGLSLHLATILLLVGWLISQKSSNSLEERNQWEGSGRGYAKLPKWLLWRAWRGWVMLLWHRELGFDSGQWRKYLSH